MPFINDMLAEREQKEFLEKSDHPTHHSRFAFDIKKVMEQLRSNIIGQPEVLNELENMLYVIKAGINDPDRPLSINLLMGPTGVGKTETVRWISKGIYGKKDFFCRIDMNTLALEHYAASLTGAPPGYVGSKEGTTLFDIEKISGTFSKPGIVLFDELEKASKEVIRSLLNVIDSGKLVLSSGNKSIDFRNSIIFMTSNIGVTEAEKSQQSILHRLIQKIRVKKKQEKDFILNALKKRFDPEFINRIDRTLVYNKLSENQLPLLLNIELSKLQQRLEKYQIFITVSEPCQQFLCTNYNKNYGARDLARTLRTKLEPMLSKEILSSPKQRHFFIDINSSNTITITPDCAENESK